MAISRLITSGSVRALYQPIVDLDTRETVAFEALARGPEGSKLESPAKLFGEAARHGLVGDLDRRAEMSRSRVRSTPGCARQ